MPRQHTAVAVDERAFDLDRRSFDLDRSLVTALGARIGMALLRAIAALGRLAWRHPWDSVGAAAAIAATVAIFVNALFLQARPHPAPMLPGKPRPVAEATGSVIAGHPRPRAAARDATASDAAASMRTRAQVVSDIQRELARRGFFDGSVDGVYGAKTDAAIRDFEQAAGVKPSAQPDEALLRAIQRAPVSGSAGGPRLGAASRNPPAAKGMASSKRVLAVQRALADFGYGQVRPSGVFGPDTKAAIERFERERKLPVTGQISERLSRELAAVTGRPLE